MKTAQELYKISKTKAPEIVAKILNGVKEHVIKKCEEKAYEGATYYTIRLTGGLSYVKDLLLKECIKIAKEFEKDENKYKVSIDDFGNGYYVNFHMTFSWDGKVHSSEFCLYNTDQGIKKEKRKIRRNKDGYCR